MILELIDYLRAPAPSWAKARGLVYESVALKSRWRRQREIWRPHQERCHQEIKRFLSDFAKTRSIVILGSGHLMEIPRDLLDDPKRSFHLIDAVHPREVIRWAKRRPQIHLHNLDLSLSAQEISKEWRSMGLRPDLVISCNLLSQLPLSRESEIAPQVVSEHLILLEQLQRQGVRSLLITDYQRNYISLDGATLKQESTLAGTTLPALESLWDWPLAPKGEVSREYSVSLSMGALRFV